MKLKEFLIQSPTGKTHAINPKTNKTYCGRPKLIPTAKITPHTLEDLGWRYRDVIPSDEHQPTCQICANHYDDPLREELSSLVGELKSTVNDFLCSAVILKDVEALGRFTENIAQFMRNERKLREQKRDPKPFFSVY